VLLEAWAELPESVKDAVLKFLGFVLDLRLIILGRRR